MKKDRGRDSRDTHPRSVLHPNEQNSRQSVATGACLPHPKPGPPFAACDQQTPIPSQGQPRCSVEFRASVEFRSPDRSGAASPPGEGLRHGRRSARAQCGEGVAAPFVAVNHLKHVSMCPVGYSGSRLPPPLCCLHYSPTGLARHGSKQAGLCPRGARRSRGRPQRPKGQPATRTCQGVTVQVARSGSHCDGPREGHRQATEPAIRHLHTCLPLSGPQSSWARDPSRSTQPHPHPHRGAGRPWAVNDLSNPICTMRSYIRCPRGPSSCDPVVSRPLQTLNVAPAPPTALSSALPARPSVPQPTTSYLCPCPSTPFSSCPPGKQSSWSLSLGAGSPQGLGPRARKDQLPRCSWAQGRWHTSPSTLRHGPGRAEWGVSQEGRKGRGKEACPGSASPKPEPSQNKLQLRVQVRKETAASALNSTQTPVPPGAAGCPRVCVCTCVFTGK